MVDAEEVSQPREKSFGDGQKIKVRYNTLVAVLFY